MKKKIYHHKNVNYLYLHFRFKYWLSANLLANFCFFLHADIQKIVSAISNTNKKLTNMIHPDKVTQTQFISSFSFGFSLSLKSTLAWQKEIKYTKNPQMLFVYQYLCFSRIIGIWLPKMRWESSCTKYLLSIRCDQELFIIIISRPHLTSFINRVIIDWQHGKSYVIHENVSKLEVT